MSGICGILLKNKEHISRLNGIETMCAALGSSKLDRDAKHDSYLNLEYLSLGINNFHDSMGGIATVSTQRYSSTLVCQGNIYNFREFNVRREDKIYDRLLNLYMNEGISFVGRLRGEFTIAIWDGEKETLYLVTDRFRIYPLLYYQDQDKIIFASNMKSILACQHPMKLTINAEAVVDIVASSFIPSPKTVFIEVNKVLPGSILTYKRGKVSVDQYWDIDFLQTSIETEKELISKTKKLFSESINIRLDVDGTTDRIGTFLSGGIDSSTITGVLTQLAKRPIKTFSIGFKEEMFNEINYARIASRVFNSDHHEYYVTPNDVIDTIPVLLEWFDEPYGNASAIPAYYCAKLAKEHNVDILYAGDGGDELFGGNERYASQRIFEYYSRIPRLPRERMLNPLVFVSADLIKSRFLNKVEKYIRRASIPYPERLTSYGLFNTIPISRIFEKTFLETLSKDYNPYESVNEYYFHAPANSELDKQLYIDLKLAISDNDLFKVTRMAEAADVAVRFPFLDHKLAEFTATIPENIKMRNRQLRYFFKKAYSDILPAEIRNKKKHGFGLPIPIWIRTDKNLNEMMRDLILSSHSIQRGYFQKKTLEEIVELHKTDTSSFYGTVLWNLMALELWLRRYMKRGQGT